MKLFGMMRRGRPRPWLLWIAALLVLAAIPAAAETLTGTVMNATMGKPAAGDDVVLLTLSQGMNETARTKTDAEGKFTFTLDDANLPHLVRVTHQGVNYFPAGGPVRPGANTVSIQVYEAAKKLDDVKANVHIMRMQAPDASTLQVIELIAVRNESTPARTLAGDRTWEIYLPEGAQIDQGDAQGPGGMPVTTMPAPDEKQKGRYYFAFPLRPGETRFQIAYHIPYSGEATLSPHVSSGLRHFAVLLPKSMQFGAHTEGVYSPMADDSGQSNLQVATNVTPGKDLMFHVAGTGSLPDAQEQEQSGAQSQGTDAGGGMPSNRPGGGLGNPEGTPDPLSTYRWSILGGCLAALAIGGLWVVSRQQTSTAPVPDAAADPLRSTAPAGTLLLEALKEELFQLEIERQQGRISGDEYAKAKAALDQTLQRALARSQSTRGST